MPLADLRKYFRGEVWVVADRDGLREGCLDAIGGFSEAVAAAAAVATGGTLPPRREEMAARATGFALAQ